MSLFEQILPSAIIAMVVAAAICGLALWLGQERGRAAAGSLALGLAYLSGHLVITGWVTFPPADTTNWLPFFALATALLGAFCGVLEIKAWPRVLIFALVSAIALRLLLKPKFSYGWSLPEGYLWVTGLAGAMVLLAIVIDALIRRSAGAFEMPALLLIVCGGTFGALMLSGSILLGQFAAVLGAAVFGSLVFAVRKVSYGRGIVPVFSLLISALVISGHFFAELPVTSAVLLAFAPVAALIPITLPGKLLTPALRLALVSIPVVVAVIWAFRSSPSLSY
jgi:hypothetical protein